MKRTTFALTAALTAGLMLPVPAIASQFSETSSTALTLFEQQHAAELAAAEEDASEEAPQAGWYADEDGWYFLDDAGERVSGWNSIDGTWYHFDEDGRMSTGWLFDGSWYWLGTSGAMHTGWNSVNGSWYLFGNSGRMRTGWQLENGSWYWLGTSGAMHANWQLIDGSWYWMSADGAMRTGWQRIDGAWYYLADDGRMLANTLTPDGYYVDASGVWDGRDPGEREFVEEWTARIDAYLAGNATAGCGRLYAQAAWDYGVDPRVLPAISCIESGKGNVCWQAYNAWGWMAWLGNSWEESIDNITRQFRASYGSTIDYAGASRYCDNPGEWLSLVQSEMWSI